MKRNGQIVGSDINDNMLAVMGVVGLEGNKSN
jgi:ubiquinone/menaquinone biosynthesis C-methylase UbiE